MASSGQTSKKGETQGEELLDTVRSVYSAVALAGETTKGGNDCCGGLGGDANALPSILGGDRDAEAIARKLGYTDEQIEIGKQGEGSNLGLGCGSPILFANLKHGETVVDLGSGGGFDSFVVAEKLGRTGTVVGVDMNPDMIGRARKNAKLRVEKGEPDNVSFRLGEIEYLPCADGFADVIISNCVVNLSLDKGQVMREAYRILKPGGRVAISDVVATADIPERLKSKEAYACWVSGAPRLGDLESLLLRAGFEDVTIDIKEESREIIAGWMPGSGAEDFVASAKVCAVKPKIDQAVPVVQVCGVPPKSASSSVKQSMISKKSKGGWG